MSITVSNSKVSYGPNIVTDGLVFYLDAINLDSYPGSGTGWFDQINNINGTMSNSAMGTAESGSMRLNNLTDSLSFGHNILLEPPNITISAWINLLDRGDRHILLTKWYGWSFEIGANRYPYLRIKGSAVYDLVSTTPINWGEWHYISSTFDDTNNIRHMYIDGVGAGSVVDAGSISYDQGTFNIPYTNNPAYGSGKIAIVQIYNKALSSIESKQNFNSQKSRFGL